MSGKEATPVPAHLAGELYLWLWWASEQQQARFDLPQPVGQVHAWVDDRLAFRRPDDTKVTAVMTGENPASSLEARAALAGGKVLQELRVGIRRDDREFSVTLKGPGIFLGGLKVPQVLSEEAAEAVVDRMFLIEEAQVVIDGLIQAFAKVRGSSAWSREVLPSIQAWLGSPPVVALHPE